MKNEVWKDIPNYEGLYQVSNFGNIKSLTRKRIDRNQILQERLLTKRTKENGYQIITLCKESKEKKCYVHRLVAQAFIPNPNNLPEINHKDENKLNNNVNNLEWCTRIYNANYNELPKKQYKKVFQYDLDGNFIKEWESIKSIKKHFNKGNNCGAISECIHNKQKTAFGFIWKSVKMFKGEE